MGVRHWLKGARRPLGSAGIATSNTWWSSARNGRTRAVTNSVGSGGSAESRVTARTRRAFDWKKGIIVDVNIAQFGLRRAR